MAISFIIIIIHEFHRDASLEQNFRAVSESVLRVSLGVTVFFILALACAKEVKDIPDSNV